MQTPQRLPSKNRPTGPNVQQERTGVDNFLFARGQGYMDRGRRGPAPRRKAQKAVWLPSLRRSLWNEARRNAGNGLLSGVRCQDFQEHSLSMPIRLEAVSRGCSTDWLPGVPMPHARRLTPKCWPCSLGLVSISRCVATQTPNVRLTAFPTQQTGLACQFIPLYLRYAGRVGARPLRRI